MKIERINENQIRAVLSREDLRSRDLDIKELAYGSDKARLLFTDLMQKAREEVGFEAENLPLMIEAIPLPDERLVMVVTKVAEPEELDTRFSRFSSDPEDTSDGEDVISREFDSIMDNLEKIMAKGYDLAKSNQDGTESDQELPLSNLMSFLREELAARQAQDREKPDQNTKSASRKQEFSLYSFSDLDRVIAYANFVDPFFEGQSSLYKSSGDGHYMLLLTDDAVDRERFLRACNIAADFGVKMPVHYGTPSWLKEHCKLILEENALETLCSF